MKLVKAWTVLIIVSSLFSCTGSSNSKQIRELATEVPEEAVAEVLEASLENDPRKIGPDKSSEQLEIEDNIYKINTGKSPLFGYWVGAFGKNKINIALARIEGDSIFGHSVCAGNFRSIKGIIQESNGEIFSIVMREPGDDQYDGEFVFEINVPNQVLEGSWKPYKNTVSAKNYKLIKREFVYDKNIGDYPDASNRYLEVPDVENFLPEEIEMIRNEIYARHGYSYTNIKIRRIFDAKDWYIPMSIDIRDQLTDIEAANIDLLYNYEDYYDEYYNDFGR